MGTIRVLTPVTRKVAEEIGITYILRGDYDKVINLDKLKEKIKELSFRVSNVTCVRSNNVVFDPYLGRIGVIYRCGSGRGNGKVRVIIDATKEEEVIELIKHEYNTKDMIKVLLGRHIGVSIPRPDIFRKVWENGDLLMGRAVVKVSFMGYAKTVMWGFTENGFVNKAVGLERHKSRCTNIPMFTALGGKLVLYNLLPYEWHTCLPVTLTVVRGPDIGMNVPACLPILPNTNEGVIKNMIKASIAIKVRKESEGFFRELIELIEKEVLQQGTAQSQASGTQGSSGASGESKGTP